MIHRIRIQNYKSLRDVTVELSPVTVLIGRSGTGKTNFCEAIRLLRDCLTRIDQSVLERLRSSKPMTHGNEGVSFVVDFSVNGYDEAFRYSLTFEPKKTEPSSECLVVSDRVVFKQSRVSAPSGFGHAMVGKWEVPPALAAIPDAGPLALPRLPGIEFATVALSSLTSGLGIYLFPYDVLEKSTSGDSSLDDNASNALGTLRALWVNPQCRRDRMGLFAALRQVNSRVLSVELDSIQSPTKSLVIHEFGDRVLSMPLSSESSGFRRFLAHLLALYQTPSKQTLIFEEPENAIFPGALATLAEEFKATPEEGRGQVILTTHNPVLLNHFDADQIRVVEMDENLETQIGPLAPEQREALQEKMLYPGELFTVDVARREHEVVSP